MDKTCRRCIYFPCTKPQCWIDNAEGCNDYEGIVYAEIRKIDERSKNK